jgi:hypothetical protein
MMGARFSRFITAAVAVAMVCVAPSAAQQNSATTGPAQIKVQAKIISGFEARDPSRRRFGQLEFRGGIELTSEHKAFGGISSITLERDGERFLAVTDKGNWLRGRIRYDGSKPVGIEDAESR